MDTLELLEEISKLQEKIRCQKRKTYDFGLAERIVKRLDSFKDCKECEGFLNDLSIEIHNLKEDPLTKTSPKYALLQKNITNHLLKEHKLLTDGYYTGIYMCFGLAIGLSLGTAIASAIHQMAYMSMGLPIGIGIGLAIGARVDAKAKKDGLVI
ncbi:MAG TPA: hypothetical protein VHT34_14985 [Clostridia bacterium]|nr:hypothetical protein [Clostridia bacterium]